jgi:hypothetical protein
MCVEGVGVGIEASSTACLLSPENVAVVVLCAHRGCMSRVESVHETSGMHVHVSITGGGCRVRVHECERRG